ncbi:hypothetical protein [Paenisporosarcina quisquiliarum]|uniref:hypothetical protein n=1 Tax=Paenisporosarcina quisquiliarum TaxID=365346 RepID=UPI00373662A0
MNQDHAHDHNEHLLHAHKDRNIVEELNVEWEVNPHHIRPGKDSEITITIKDKHGIPATTFAVVHEKQMHLLAISKDLSVFLHLHPEYTGDGEFKVTTQFPAEGTYKLYADFMPEGGSQQLATFEAQVGEEESEPEIKVDQKLKKTIKDLSFKLEFDVLKARQHINMGFTISDADTNEPINKLEPYLGSAGHVVIVSEDLKEFLHVHPTDEETTGPAVSYITTFPEPGIYKIWGQFKYNKELFTVPFVINVSDS